MGNKYRHELKFVCSEKELQFIENRIKYICTRDSHAGPDGIYLIRSMYFDTYDDSCYGENIAGTDDRAKYRIRIYNASDRVIKLERKSSVSNLKCKESCLITKAQCEQMIRGDMVEAVTVNQDVLREFIVEQKLSLLSPRVIVEYVRTPYVYPVGNVRITFDRHIRGSDSKDFFSQQLSARSIMPENIHILEVKYDAVLPNAILELIGTDGNLRRTSFSKYALCRKYSM